MPVFTTDLDFSLFVGLIPVRLHQARESLDQPSDGGPAPNKASRAE
jgi:hypothetical protein